MSPREQLLQRQYGLLAALVGDGPTPPGFPERRVAIVSRGLASKRRREALYCWPGIAAETALFDEFARAHARPPGASPLRDGYRFAAWLALRGDARGAFIVRGWAETDNGVVRRSWLGAWVTAVSLASRRVASTLRPGKSKQPTPALA